MAKEQDRILKTWTPDEKHRVAAAVAKVAEFLSSAEGESADSQIQQPQVAVISPLLPYKTPSLLSQVLTEHGSTPQNAKSSTSGFDRASMLRAGAEMRKSIAVELE
jgi:hypothetical protein